MSDSGSSSTGGSGGLSAGSALSAAAFGYNLLSMFGGSKKKQKYYINQKDTYAYKIQKRKNLLDEQLATKRAQLGAMGITNSASAEAVQARMAREAFDDINNQSNTYNYQGDTNETENSSGMNKNLLKVLLSVGTKIIK